ncbi:MAG TPA: GNAT family N-acetyltransferase, partial [Anaerovoracaceae bacterium]|nr:GNAT family N-acetyltransferase [Anaerovoracaceae bacterium]
MDIKEVNNYRKLGKLFKDSGIEVKTFDDLPEGVIAAYEGYIDDEFVGGVSIQKKNGEYLIYDIAVMKELRGKHIGRALLLHALNKINEF